MNKETIKLLLDELEYRIGLRNGSGKWVDENAKLKNQHIIEFIKPILYSNSSNNNLIVSLFISKDLLVF